MQEPSLQPFERNMLHPIEKAIMVANIGFNPMNNGDLIIISVPLTEEKTRSWKTRVEAEDAKVGIRNARKDANTEIKKLEKMEPLKTFVKVPKKKSKP
jgi:ribosome recycling factor